MTKTFGFAGIILRFESDRIIANSDGFDKFLCDGKPDVTVKIVEGKLPERAGTVILKRRNHIAYDYDGEQRYFSFYHLTSDEVCYYACFVPGKDGATLYIDHPDGLWDVMIFDALNFGDRLLESDRYLLHCSFIEHNGKAVLFTAPKQTGKSTQARLWEQYRNADVINGDRAIIKNDGGVLYACGTPYRGSSDICENREYPIEAIVYLSQATENSIERLTGVNAFIKVFEGVTYSPEITGCLEKATGLVMNTIGSVPVYHLACTPDENAVKTLENEINNLKR